MNEITILLRDDIDHLEYNMQIMSFLNEKYIKLNSKKFSIRPIRVHDTNIDTYARIGIRSLPALLNHKNHQENGVSNIIKFLNTIMNSSNSKPMIDTKSSFQNTLKKESMKSLEEVARENQEDERQLKDGPGMNPTRQSKLAAQFNYIGKDPMQMAGRPKKQPGVSEHTIIETDARTGPYTSFSNKMQENAQQVTNPDGTDPPVKYDDLDPQERKFLQSFSNAPESDDEFIYEPDSSL